MNKITAILLLVILCSCPALGLTHEAVYQFLIPYFEKPIELSSQPDYKVEYDLGKDRLQVKFAGLRQFDPTFSIQSWNVYTLSMSQDPEYLKEQFSGLIGKLRL